MNYKDILLISDVDGTMLEKGFGVPGKNLEAVERFVGRGGRFTVATDRSAESVGRFLDWIPLSAPAILLGGAVIYDFASGKFYKKRPIGADWHPLAALLGSELPQLAVELYGENSCSILRINACSAAEHHADHTSYTVTDAAFVSGPVYKLRLCGPEESIDRAESLLAELTKEGADYNGLEALRTDPNGLDIGAGADNKRSAAVELAARLQLLPQQIAAIGNGPEDTALLQYAGFAGAVGKACVGAKQAAAVVVAECGMGGLAEFIGRVEAHYHLTGSHA